MIADAVMDRYSNKEILLLYIRYLNCTKERPAIEEAFLASTHISGRPIGEKIVQHILDLLDSHGIMIEDCHGQAYDGASAMSSTVKGASAVIKRKQPLVEVVHCRSYCINSAIVFACKNDVVSKFMDDLTSLCCFFAKSPKWQQYFETFIDYHKDELSISDSNKKHVNGLAKTRWVERPKACENYYILYRFVVATFESICSPTLYHKDKEAQGKMVLR